MRARMFLRWARVLMWVTLGVYVLVLLVPGARFGAFGHGLNIAAQMLPALVCWLYVRTAHGRRAEVTWLAVAISAFAAGNVVLAVAEAREQTLPVPSLADVGYMSFYPAALVAVLLSTRRDHPQTVASVWTDSCIGGLAAASAVAVLLKPAFSSDQRTWLSTSVSLAYPVGDLLLVFAVVAVAGLRQGSIGRHWLAMLAGLTVFTCADVIYDLQIAHGGYVVGTPLDAVWAIGLAIMTLWAAPARPAAPAAEERVDAARSSGPLALLVSGAAAAVGLSVLIIGTLVDVTPVATVLAAAAIAGSAVRAQQGLRYQQRVSDLRREAQTLERLVQAQDAERARIADDVHDDSLQVLAAVDLRLGALRRRLRSSAPDEIGGVDTVTEAVHEAAVRLRSLMFRLEAPALDAQLADALRDAAAHIFEDSGTRWSVLERRAYPLPPPLRATAYRIAREALVNARKHAAADTVTVTVDADECGVRVEVLDDGVGVPSTAVDTGRRHSGVVGMRDRAAAAGGWWQSSAGPGGVGTLVCFQLPLEPGGRTSSSR